MLSERCAPSTADNADKIESFFRNKEKIKSTFIINAFNVHMENLLTIENNVWLYTKYGHEKYRQRSRLM